MPGPWGQMQQPWGQQIRDWRADQGQRWGGQPWGQQLRSFMQNQPSQGDQTWGQQIQSFAQQAPWGERMQQAPWYQRAQQMPWWQQPAPAFGQSGGMQPPWYGALGSQGGQAQGLSSNQNELNQMGGQPQTFPEVGLGNSGSVGLGLASNMPFARQREPQQRKWGP
jgi:hypothetical protein